MVYKQCPVAKSLDDIKVPYKSTGLYKNPEAELLDEIQTKVSTVQLLYTAKEKGGKPDRKPYPLSLYSLRNLYVNIKS
jgi:hypothetical protein